MAHAIWPWLFPVNANATPALTVVAIACFSLVLLRYLVRPSRSRLPLPPGPKPLPIIGNLLDFPEHYEWVTYDRWRKKYGDVVYVESLGQSIVILGSWAAVSDLLDRRSAIYSDRGRAVMVVELMGFGFSFSALLVGDEWRARRKAFHPFFTPAAVTNYHPLQTKHMHVLLNELLKSPGDFMDLLRRMMGDIIMEIVYGMADAENVNKYHQIADEVISMIAVGQLPGAYMVNFIPALKYVPAWLPGAGFQRIAAHCRHLIKAMIEEPLQAVKDAQAAGQAKPCMLAEMLDNGEDESVAKDVAGITYSAAVDTTIAAVAAFFAAMMNYPEVQAKAQAELDSVIGTDRLPGFEDRADLPYINAIILEVLRWQPPTHVAIPHTNSAADEYKGYYIPKGSLVIPNAWAILHDPVAYPNPDCFIPERFLTVQDGKYMNNPDVQDPRIAVFGFGRRICPGRYLAEDTLFLAATMVLATFTVFAPPTGRSLPVDVEVTSGVLSVPLPFQCVIKARSPQAQVLIQASLEG